MSATRRTVTFLIACASVASAAMSDSIPITGHYVQDGRSLQRREMEKVLLNTPATWTDADQAKGLRVASGAVGASMWILSAGIEAWEIYDVVQSVENGRPFSVLAGDILLPLSIGTEVASFIQGRIVSAASYRFRKAVVTYNDQLCARLRLHLVFDHRIEPLQGTSGWYVQDNVAIAPSELYPILLHEPASAGSAFRSGLYRETANGCLNIGLALVTMAVITAIDNRHASDYAISGGSLTAFGFVNVISSVIARKHAITHYNTHVSAERHCGEVPPAPPPAAGTGTK